MEEREGEAGREKAAQLKREYAGRIGRILATFHPWGLPGEVVGKSSNENWAARRAKETVVDREGLNIDYVTITSCDADTVFDLKYFACLTYKFALEPKRYRRFWQAPIFFYNNIWEVPARCAWRTACPASITSPGSPAASSAWCSHSRLTA